MPPSKRAPIRILVVDDHPLMRLGVVALLESQADMQVVAEASSGEESLALYASRRPDIVVMDLRMPGVAGAELIRALRERDRDARVVVLTSFDTETEVQDSFAAGAKAYLRKDTEPLAVLAAIRKVHAGQREIPAEIAARLGEAQLQTPLTPRERDVLALLARGLTNKEIGSALGIAEETAKEHVRSILAKLEAAGRTEAVMQAIRKGLVRPDE